MSVPVNDYLAKLIREDLERQQAIANAQLHLEQPKRGEPRLDRMVTINWCDHPEFGKVFCVLFNFKYLPWCYTFKSDATDAKLSVECATDVEIAETHWIDDFKDIPNLG